MNSKDNHQRVEWYEWGLVANSDLCSTLHLPLVETCRLHYTVHFVNFFPRPCCGYTLSSMNNALQSIFDILHADIFPTRIAGAYPTD